MYYSLANLNENNLSTVQIRSKKVFKFNQLRINECPTFLCSFWRCL